jgi:ribosomal protein L20
VVIEDSVLFRVANQQVMKALRYSYVGKNKRESSEESKVLMQLQD